jgi:hypothetical protein
LAPCRTATTGGLQSQLIAFKPIAVICNDIGGAEEFWHHAGLQQQVRRQAHAYVVFTNEWIFQFSNTATKSCTQFN